MTSWRYGALLFFFVFLIMINLSKEGCHEYFEVEEWKENLKVIVPIIETKDSKDTMECAVERMCLEEKRKSLAHATKSCSILGDCFEKDIPKTLSTKCEGNVFQNISFYHFMCLTAKVFDKTPAECEYDGVCKLFSETSRVSNQTTTMPTITAPATLSPTTTILPSTTTLPETTTVLPSTTTLPETATTTVLPSTTTLPETATTTVLPSTTTLPETATTTVLPSTTTTLAPTSTIIQSADSGANDQRSDKSVQYNTDTIMILLKVSVIFNVILPLAVYLFMRHRWARDKNQWNSTHVSNGNVLGAQPVKEFERDTMLENRGVETSYLMEPSECHSVHEADSNNCGAAEVSQL